MIDSICRRLSGKRILIAGFGREGKSTLRFLQQYMPDAIVGIADKNESAFQDVDKERYDLFFGDDYLRAASDYDIVIKTPGISVKDVDIDLSLISSQTDLFLEAYHNQVIGVTGTKGKSTTSSLIYHLLKESGNDVILAGNIGIPILDCVSDINERTIVVYELSAHQLQFINRSPHVGILLNVFEEHLDHFGTFEKYKDAKVNVLRYMDDSDIAVVNQSTVNSQQSTVAKRCVDFESYDFDGYNIDWNQIPLLGEHNKRNVKAALCACKSYGLLIENLIPHLYTFKSLEHRQEFVGVFNGVKFFNDSISTIPQATIAALQTIKNVNFLLLGGFDRGIDYEPLVTYLKDNVLPCILITGQAGQTINAKLQEAGYKGNVLEYTDMESAFEIIGNLAKSGDVCLLSPAAASYDRYKNFEERGCVFKELAKKF
ncbi:MAG: UDP-N-acetylmuramoyl-L-alanine--D-glutamate ligase [Bacteroidales bacterium]|nr:UDP-N-acetylmuramoyl-L-alanine--D-glutamate ligase [Bacteroidales bacterium]